MSWFVDPGLAVLIAQVKEANPGMTVYTIGDANHASTVSDHNPDKDGSVDAADFMIRDNFTAADAENLFQQLRASRDSRIKYVIYNRRIFSRTVSPWTVRAYSGTDPHTNHVHVSIEDVNKSTARWNVGIREVLWENFIARLPVLKRGDRDPIMATGTASYVGRVQKQLPGVTVDGDYGPITTAAIDSLGTNTDGLTVDLDEYAKLYALWTITQRDWKLVPGRVRDITVISFDAKLPVLKYGDSDANGGITGGSVSYVGRVQRALGVEPDGEYGPATATAVKALGVNDGRTVNLNIYAPLYGIWGFVRSGVS